MSGGPTDYPLLLLGTTCLGLGFGLMAAPVNSYPALLFPAHRGSALVAMHTLIGLGFALGPLLLAQAITLNGWQGYPWLIAALSITLALAALTLPATTAAPEAASASVPNPGSLWGEPVFWVFAAIAMLYAFAEGTFANWAVIYLADAKKLDPAIAAYALSAFWLTLAVGRLIVSVLVLKIAPTLIWRALPLGMLAVFFMLPLADSAWVGISLFALAGLSCSAVFPLTIELASQRFALHGPQVGALLTAALMIGVGVGSYAVGLLRETVPLETLYSLSALYPALLWGLTWWAVRPGTGSKT
jgi:fucose permease